MKKILYVVMMCFSVSCFAQVSIDDGFVTSRLGTGSRQAWIDEFVTAFSDGVYNGKAGKYSSPDYLIEKEKYDIRQQPPIEQWLQRGGVPVSDRFLQKIISIKNRIGLEYTTMPQIRNGLREIAIAGNMSSQENAYMAALDISLQVVANNFNLNPLAADGSMLKRKVFLPKWLKCAFGILGGSLLGGINGAGLGTLAFPGVGTAAGAVIGMIGGGAMAAGSLC